MMVQSLPQIKVYDIDYNFIVSNYTDQKLWDKEWVLFHFKNYVYRLNLSKIDTKAKEIIFEIKLSSDLDIYYNWETIELRYNINNMSIDFLKKLIYSKMKAVAQILESRYIMNKDELYLTVQDGIYEEREQLRKIANDFLDKEGVSNDEIRDAYIDKYVDDNETIWSKLNSIENQKKYTYLTDLYLILAEINEDEELKRNVENSGANDFNKIQKEVEKAIENLKSEEYKEEMQYNLEAI